MEKVTLYEFENEQAFEDYLIESDFANWPYFQENLITEPHTTVGLLIDDKLVSAAKLQKNKSGIVTIYAIQTHTDLQRNGYGRQLINLIDENYACQSGLRVRWTDKSLKFWIALKFQFSYDFNFMIR